MNWLYCTNDYSARGIESDFPFAAVPCMQMCVMSSLTLMIQAFGFKDHTGCDVFNLYDVLNGRPFCPLRPLLWQVEVKNASAGTDESNYNFRYLLRQWNSWGISCYLHVLFVMLTFLCFCQEWSIRHIGNAEVKDSLSFLTAEFLCSLQWLKGEPQNGEVQFSWTYLN